jgi:hypothetical protein
MEEKIMLETKLVRYLVCLVVLGFSATVAIGGDILFVIDDLANLHGGDAVIKHFFEGLGHTVMYFDDDEDEVTTESAAAAVDLVYISESVVSGKIQNEITEIETPIIVAEPYCFYEMGMSSVEAADQRLDSVSIRIIEPDHPLAAGYSGNVAVLAEPDEGTLIPGPSRAGGDAVVIAKGSGDRQKNADVYFLYDKGAALARPAGDGSGRIAADIRIGFFAASPKAQALLFLQGYDLLEAAVNYALGTTDDVKACDAGGATIQEDTAASITLGGSDLDGDPLTYSVVTGPRHGCLSGTAPNLFYTPRANFNGSDSFTFKVNDGTADSAVATVLIMVTAVNDPPKANDDSVTIQEDTLAPITLSGSDLDGDPLTYSVLTGPCHGCLNGTAPNLIYTPKANFSGLDSFTFKVNDGTADSDVATVSITVTAVNDPPGVSYDSVTTQLDRPVVTIDVDTDVGEEPLTVTTVTQDTECSAAIKTSVAPDANVCSTDVVTETCSEGSEAIKTDSTLSGAPDANVCSTDVVTETCSEGEGEIEIAMVKIAIKVVNAEPAITSIPVTAVEVGALYTYDVNATDPDVGDTLTYSLTTKPAGMTIEPDTGLIQWTPEDAHVGAHDIVVKVVDSNDIPASDTQLFTITVNPVSLPPIITLTIADGYDEKDKKTLLADGKTGVVQASNDSWWETGFDSYTSYDFSDVSIPAGATIASVVINVEHFEEERFSSGKLQWGIGTGWPGNPVVWTSTEAPVREGQRNEAIDSWDVTNFVGKRKTLVNYIYAVVKWY